MPSFRKKPVVIEAVQVTWKTWEELCEFVPEGFFQENPARHVDESEASDMCGEFGGAIQVGIPTLEGVMTANHGDWIIKGVNGEFYPCKPDIFN
ncbi:MAG: hypothetical protein GVY22_10330, partial [Gammaproteobacteria bacterium]|nr:hypothetical protein [Gammaproteobacteria bacterium]